MVKLAEPIVIQLQNLASEEEANIEDLLRKALLVSSKLNLVEFSDWCRSELEGYKSIDSLPHYRIITGDLKFHNPMHGMIPFVGDLGSAQRELCTSRCFQPLSYFTNLLSVGEGSFLSQQISSEAQKIFNSIQYRQYRKSLSGNAYISTMDNFFTPFIGYIVYDKSLFLNIFSEVRNKILVWSLQLEQEGILGEGLQFSVKEQVAAMSVNHFNIQNMQGVAGSVSGGTINQNNQMNVQLNDFDSLAKYLIKNNVEFSDIQILKNAIEVDPPMDAPGKFGVNVSNWIGSMMAKAANGSWEISIATAGTLLAEAISKFYGLS